MITPYIDRFFDDSLFGLSPFRRRRRPLVRAFDLVPTFGFDMSQGPRFEVDEDESAYKITGHLRGVDPKDVSLDYDESTRTLKVSGSTKTRREEKDEDGEPAYVFESASSFSRSFVVPEGVDKEAIEADLKGEELVIVVPKPPKPEEPEEPESTKVPINFV